MNVSEFKMNVESETSSFKVASEGSLHQISGDDFEFSFSGLDITADEIEDEKISRVYPLFGRDIHLPFENLTIGEESKLCQRSGSASSSSSTDDLEGIPANSYCAWTPRSVPPSPDRYKKSGSTGSESRQSRILDMMAGRSHSDGKEKFVFLRPAEKKLPSSEVVKVKGKENRKGRKVTEMDMATAHRLYYSRNTGAAGQRSFLPYKQDLVGLLGLSRSHPF